jgi:hypothetical protein
VPLAGPVVCPSPYSLAATRRVGPLISIIAGFSALPFNCGGVGWRFSSVGTGETARVHPRIDRAAVEAGSLPNLRRVIQGLPHLLTYNEPREGNTLTHEAVRFDRVRMLVYLHTQEPLAVELANKRNQLPT